MKIELTEEQKSNLLVFLGRVELKGAEVPAFVDIYNAINESKEE